MVSEDAIAADAHTAPDAGRQDYQVHLDDVVLNVDAVQKLQERCEILHAAELWLRKAGIKRDVAMRGEETVRPPKAFVDFAYERAVDKTFHILQLKPPTGVLYAQRPFCPATDGWLGDPHFDDRR